jgi:uncharacterized protein (UPF0548 family)
MLLTFGAPSPDAIGRVLEDGRAAAPTYAPIGASLGDELPPGYRHDRWSVVLGRGTVAFDRAVAGLRQWAGHRHAGIAIHPADVPPVRDAVVAIVIPVAPAVTLTVANRIVAVVDEDRRFAIAYGTLPGHGEQGEEAFVINRHDDDAVTFDITAFSRPVGVARLGAPVVRRLQQRATSRYLAGLQQFVKGEHS